MEPTREMWGKARFLWELGENDGLCIWGWLKPDQDLMDKGQMIGPGAPTTITPKVRPKTCVILVTQFALFSKHPSISHSSKLHHTHSSYMCSYAPSVNRYPPALWVSPTPLAAG